MTKEIRARIYNFSTNTHDVDGKEILTLEKAVKALEEKRKFMVFRWAVALHDKDVMENGEPKAPHIHIVMEYQNPQLLKSIANMFGLPEHIIQVAKGKGAFLDCVRYLTHESGKEQEAGKYLYPDSEIHANFDFREEIGRNYINDEKVDKKSLKRKLRNMVLKEGYTVRQIEELFPLEALEDSAKLNEARKNYLSKIQVTNRTNLYIDGAGGIGKSLLAQSIARVMYPQYEYDEEIFFVVGAQGSTFEGYTGQPVIIWDDARVETLIATLGRENLFQIFDPFPKQQKQNVKFGSVNLINEVNIVNGVVSYVEFLDGLAGEYTDRQGNKRKAEDKSQSYRRFPIIIPVEETQFMILINQGWLEGSREFFQYNLYHKTRIGVKEAFLSSKEDKGALLTEVITPVIEAKDIAMEAMVASEQIDVMELGKRASATEEEILDMIQRILRSNMGKGQRKAMIKRLKGEIESHERYHGKKDIFNEGLEEILAIYGE